MSYPVGPDGMLVTQSCLTLCDPMDYSPPGSSVYGILQEYWSELSFPPPGDAPHPETEPGSLALQEILYSLSHQAMVRAFKSGGEREKSRISVGML